MISFPSRRTARRVVVATGVVALVATGVVAAADTGSTDPAGDYRLATATTTDVTSTLPGVGTVEAASTAEIGFPTDGTIASIEVAGGDTVAAGDVVATLDSTGLERGLTEARDTLAQAEWRLEQARAGEPVTGAADPDTGGDTSGASGPATAESATAESASAEELAAYEKEVDAAAAAVAVAEQALAQATVVSPIEGTVMSVESEVGDDVAAAAPVVVVEGAGGLQVTTSVSVAELPDVEVGQAATIDLDGSSETLDGEVVAVAEAPMDDGESYRVTVAASDLTQLASGVLADVAIVTATTEGALAVPTSAVATTGTSSTVTVLDNGQATTQPVQVGTVGPTWTEILDGLEEGTEVVLADLTAPLPTSATDAATGTSGGAGGGQFQFPGGGAGGGGAPPGGFGGGQFPP